MAIAAVAFGGVSTLVIGSAHVVTSTSPTCAVGSGAYGTCDPSKDIVDNTLLKDTINYDASSDREVQAFLFAPDSTGASTCSTDTSKAVMSFTSAPVGGSASTHTGSLSTDPGYAATKVGTYEWTADIYVPSTGKVESGPTACGLEKVVISKAQPDISTDPGGSTAIGGTMTDSATVSGGDNPTGSVTFKLYSPSDQECESSEPVQTWTDMPLNGNGVATTSPGYTSTQLGTYHWVAIYNGDANNNTAESDCIEAVTIGAASPAINTTPSAGGVVGTKISDSATVSDGDSPTGTVTFNLYGPGDTSCGGTVLYTDTVTLPLSGPLTVTSGDFTTTASGTYSWMATYTSNSSNNGNASSACGAETVVITSSGVQGIGSGVQAISTPGTGAGLMGGLLVGGLLILGGTGFAILSRKARQHS